MTFQAYTATANLDFDFLPTIPSHWKAARLKQIIQLIESGTSVNAIDTPAEENEFGVLKTSCVYRGSFDPTENKAIVAEEYDRANCPLRDNALIVSRMNTPDLVGAAGLVRRVVKNLFLPDRLWQVCIADALPSFVHFWTLTASYRGQVQAVCSGTSASMQNLAQDQFRNFVLPLPPVSEQAAIVDFLDRETGKIDALVAEQEKLIALLKEKRQAVISHAVTKGLDPSAPMKDSGIEWLGKVPAHWEVMQVRHFAEVLRGKFTHRPRNDPAYYDGEHPFIQTGDITGATKFITEYRQTLSDLGVTVSKEFPSGTLVMAIAANIGDVAILNFAAYFPDSVVGLLPNAKIDIDHLYFLMQAMKHPMLMTATISTQMNLNVDQIMSLKAPIPPRIEQQKIVSHIEEHIKGIDELIHEAQEAVALLNEYRSALISASVTGKIDVRGLADAEPERKASEAA